MSKTSQLPPEISIYRINNAIRARKIPAPMKDASGHYLWTEEDVERLRQALANDRRRRKPVAAAAS